MKAWHFLREDRRLGYNDNRLVRKGSKFVHKGELDMCRSGLHASVKILDALKYAPGPIICRVEMGGLILEDDDKLVASERKVLWWIDGTDLLREFVCWCALDVIHLWDAPDVVVRYLNTRDESIRAAAKVAAWDAAWAAENKSQQLKQNRRLTRMVMKEARRLRATYTRHKASYL